jgi:hypothetical protein
MKAICVSEFGGPEVLKLEDMPDPRPPQSGGVLVSVNAAGVTEESGKGEVPRMKTLGSWEELDLSQPRYCTSRGDSYSDEKKDSSREP